MPVLDESFNHTWTYGPQKYILHTLRLRSTLPSTEDTVISTLVDPCMIGLLPQNLDAVPFPTDPCFIVKQTEYKGAGMFAAKDISVGDLIINEHPVIILPNKPLPHDSTAYDEAGYQLPESVRQEMFTLTNYRSKEDCPSAVEGIARTNALSLDFDYPKEMLTMEKNVREYGGIFLKINRCNHSCGPNASHKWNPNTLSSSLYALRDITAGEEITITYTDPTQPRAKRVATLQKNYGFTCDCPWCTLPETMISKSDNARLELQNWFGLHISYAKWLRDLCRPDDTVIFSHFEALELVEQEGLHGMQSVFVEEIMYTYAALGDGPQFEKWAEKVIRLCAIPDPELCKEIKRWVEVGEEGRRRDWKKWSWRNKQRKRESLNTSMCRALSAYPEWTTTEMTWKGGRGDSRSPSPFYGDAFALLGDSSDTD